MPDAALGTKLLKIATAIRLKKFRTLGYKSSAAFIDDKISSIKSDLINQMPVICG